MTDLERDIMFWSDSIAIQGYLISPAIQGIIKSTIKHLKELKQLKGE